MFPLEVATGLGSAVVGFVFRYLKQKQENELQKHKVSMDVAKSIRDDRAQSLEAGLQDKGFAWTRRILAVGTFASALWVPLIIAAFTGSMFVFAIPAVDTESTKMLFGVFSDTHTSNSWQYITGFPMTNELWHLIFMISGLYFGGSKR